jgi:hypothetical protein
MDVLKSYAHQVASYHPQKARDELFAEIYDDLCEEYADWRRNRANGTPVEFLDERREHPMRQAARLAGEGQNYLVGPQFYYPFIAALKMAATLTAALYLGLAILSALGSGNWWRSFLQMLLAWPHTLMWVCLAILGVFVALERSGERAAWLDRWKASDLPPLDSHQQVSRVEALFDIGIDVVGLLWITRVIELPTLFWHAGEPVVAWQLNLPVAVLVVAGCLFALDIVFSLWRLRRGFWTRRLRWTCIAGNAAWLAVLGWVLTYRPLLSLVSTADGDLEGLSRLVNNALSGIVVVVMVVLAWDAVVHLWRLRGAPVKSNSGTPVDPG